jgi:hypothetical protein
MLRSGDLGDHDGSTDHVGGTPLPAFTVNVELAIVAFTDNVPALIVHGSAPKLVPVKVQVLMPIFSNLPKKLS